MNKRALRGLLLIGSIVLGHSTITCFGQASAPSGVQEETVPKAFSPKPDFSASKEAKKTKRLKVDIRTKYGILPVDTEGPNGRIWTSENLMELSKTLAMLPKEFRLGTTQIIREAVFPEYQELLAAAIPETLDRFKVFDSALSSMDKPEGRGMFRRTIVHEMTITFLKAAPKLLEEWESTFWEKGIPSKPPSGSPTVYGNVSPLEDMAETVCEYLMAGPLLRKADPARFSFVRERIMAGREFQPDPAMGN